MEIYIDTCDRKEIAYWINCGICAGVTTNPTIIKRSGVRDVEKHLAELSEMLGDRQLSIQVINMESDSLIEEALRYISMGKNIVIKVPIVSPDGNTMLSVIHDLTNRNIRVNATAIMTSIQAIMAAMAGARYVSLFWGRILDGGSEPSKHIKETKAWINENQINSKIIVGSIRTVENLSSALETLPHICTVPPDVLHKAMYHTMSHKVSKEFEESARTIIP